MEEIFFNRLTHVNELIVKKNSNIPLEYIAKYIDLSRITRFSYWQWEMGTSSSGVVRILHTLPRLRSLGLPASILILLFDRHWPHIVDLDMLGRTLHSSQSLTSFEIDSLWRSFTHLEKFSCYRQGVQDVKRLFDNRTATLSNVLIRHEGDINGYDPPLITCEWLEQNTQLCQFDYFPDTDGVVCIWL